MFATMMAVIGIIVAAVVAATVADVPVGVVVEPQPANKTAAIIANKKRCIARLKDIQSPPN